jgi:hypothetical protein
MASKVGGTMSSFVFAASDNIDAKDFGSLVTFDDKFEEWFEVVLANENELFTLFGLLGIDRIEGKNLNNSEDFEKLYDYSSYKLPEFSEQQFDGFYDEWLKHSGRESDMDEYGQLIFIQGHAAKWNKNANRIVLQTKP